MPRFYSRILTDTLQEYVEASLDAPPHEQLNLFEELALMRVTAQETVKLFSAAQQSENQETRVAAAVLVQEALRHVITTCEAAARVEASGREKISVHSIAHVVRQIVRIAHEVFSDEREVHGFEKEIRTHVKIIGDRPGTELTPDGDVTSMDETVPAETRETVPAETGEVASEGTEAAPREARARPVRARPTKYFRSPSRRGLTETVVGRIYAR